MREARLSAAGKKGEVFIIIIIIMLFLTTPPTQGYLGYPTIGAGEGEGRVRPLVLAPPCGGQAGPFALHHAPHRLLPPDLLSPRAGFGADLRWHAKGVGIRREAAIVSQWPQGLSIWHALSTHACHTDLREAGASQCHITVYTHFWGL